MVPFLFVGGFSPLSAKALDLNPTKTEISAFMKADTNKDRVLTPQEFKTFIQAMASSGSKTAKKIRFLSLYSYAFSIADANRDGVATPHEMRAADNSHGVGSK
ncbi:hypothetical protein [uncultured Roseibium sp.]|uniref:hypothetical protein n=1 Tax=uncultured Roseibium sp. TaxID=1936171 RepID=UPI003216D4B1